jgi:group I intron endonuclease
MKPYELITQGIKDSTKSGIYMILCIPSNKAYIGQAKNIYRRWTSHRWELKRGTHGNIHLQRAYDKYGPSSFSYIVLENQELNLDALEAQYLDKLDEECRMNLAGVTGLVPCSKETREKISRVHKGKILTEETKKKISEAKTGRKQSSETIAKRAATLRGLPKRKGFKWSEEAKARAKGRPSNRKGKRCSEEHKKKISEAKKSKGKIQPLSDREIN